ncbi:hypothetical protein DICVIV_05034 [Dictyocaulus viviparus]|uniref:Uncharacterized protein n=1 Tax=Dictyocaulus viviparus TaxID=29172 RepID=A0A0D8XYL2_DICVI|nr:hypothetical protein DICVIV_05034 [Dictyocaulus viviparus]
MKWRGDTPADLIPCARIRYRISDDVHSEDRGEWRSQSTPLEGSQEIELLLCKEIRSKLCNMKVFLEKNLLDADARSPVIK